MPEPHGVVVRLMTKDPNVYETVEFKAVSVTQAGPAGISLHNAEGEFIAFFPYGEIRDVVARDHDERPSGVVGVTLH